MTEEQFWTRISVARNEAVAESRAQADAMEKESLRDWMYRGDVLVGFDEFDRGIHVRATCDQEDAWILSQGQTERRAYIEEILKTVVRFVGSRCEQ